ncbi:MAG TPA: FAD-binding oxidoreductase, partial [Longimicrobiales bacterium]|nr:FAD-binding oxidoreductase [Longimicrobiales bacterium]
MASVADGLASLLPDDQALVTGSEAEEWAVGDRVPSAVAHPGSVEELARVMERASSEGWAVAPAGGGSWIDGGGPPDRLDLVVTTRRLHGVEVYEPGDLTRTAGAGLSVEELRRETGARGQWFPQDPPGAARGTLGGLVATGLPGPLRSGFGRPRDQVLGLTVVTGDG